MYPMHCLAHIVIRKRSDGAGIQNDELSIRSVSRRTEPLRKKRRLQRCPIGLRSPAPKTVDMEALHCFNSNDSRSLAFIRGQ